MRGRGGALPAPLDRATPVVVLGLDRGVFHHGVLGIARSAGRLGVPVHRVGLERWAPAATSRYVTGWEVVPEGASEEQILDTLRDIGQRIGPALLVAADDAASVFVDEQAGTLASEYLLASQPVGLARLLASKRGMYELCQTHGVPTPLSTFPEAEEDVLAHAEQVGLPTVLKCINAADAPPSSPRVSIARTREELIECYRQMRPPGVSNVLLQEYVPGTPETVWMFNGYFDARSDCKVGFTGRKIRQSPPYTGAATLGVCMPNAAVYETTVRFMRAIGYRGILDIGYRFDSRDGQYKLLDVNPRIGGTFRLFVDEHGMDVLRALHLDLTGREVPANSSPDGRRWVVEPLDVASSIIYARGGDITLGGWARSFRGVREAAWFALDDVAPFLALLPALLLARIPNGRKAR
jgi:predicted ATP-grasp superfamily ATP-dependent carboligase